MAKKEKAADKAAAKKAKSTIVQNNYQIINDFDGVVTSVQYIRNHGCIVREVTKNSVTATFVPDVKPKKKGVNYTLVKDTEEMRNVKAEKRREAKAKGEPKGKKTKKGE